MIFGLSCIGILIFVKNDYFLYQETIAKVQSVIETNTEGDPTGLIYNQQITAIVKNGDKKGEIIEFGNKRYYSGVYDYYVEQGDELFVSFNQTVNSIEIQGFKRDFYLVLEVLIFCFALVLVASKRSLLYLASLIINILIFAVIVILRFRGINIFLLFIAGVLLFTCLTLFLIAGINKKSVAAIISTLISVSIMMLIALIIFRLFTADIHYETIEYVQYFYDFDKVFYSGVLVSGLGAIMDIAIIMSSSINELISRNREISYIDLKKSAWVIAQDITGTMMNVLVISCIAGAMPLFIYLVYNGMPINMAIEYYGSAEIIRALTGCIGIVLAVPVSYLINMGLRRRWKT